MQPTGVVINRESWLLLREEPLYSVARPAILLSDDTELHYTVSVPTLSFHSTWARTYSY